jgi:hypothetical protein
MFVRALGLKNAREWKAYRISRGKPLDIPSNPNTVYAEKGWAGDADWFGYTGKCLQARSFKQARKFVRSLKLKSKTEWCVYSNSGKRPEDIPSTPNHIYKGKGWAGYRDFLGTV